MIELTEYWVYSIANYTLCITETSFPELIACTLDRLRFELE